MEKGSASNPRTLRLLPGQEEELDLIARVEESTFTDAVRVAVDELIERRREDLDFQTRLKAYLARDRALAKRLSAPDA